MWCRLAVVGIGCAIAACGGRSRSSGDQSAPPDLPLAGAPAVGVVEPQAEQGCFPVTVLSDDQMRELLASQLGVELPAGSVDASEPNALVRGQQLVDAVELGLEAAPAKSREILRSFVGVLVGEGTFMLPAALPEAERNDLQQQLDRFVEHWAVEQRGSLDFLLAGSPLDLVGPPAEQRAGFMTLGAFLARVPSPPQRGMHLAEQLACVVVPPPPLLESEWSKEPKRPAKTIVEQTYGNEVVCAACHIHYIGYAIALDRYDELGRYRESLNGAAIDTAYSLAMPVYEPRPASNDGTTVSFSAPSELGRALSQSGGVRACLIRKLNQQLVGSDPSETELSCVLEKLAAKQGNLRSALAMLAPRLLGAP